MAFNFSYDYTDMMNYSEPFTISEEDFLPEELPESLKTTLSVLYSIIMAGAFLGNSLVICVILANETMRNVTNVFLVSLALSDILIAVWNVPLMLVFHLHSEWTLGEPLCKTLSFMTSVNVLASILALTVVAIER